MDRTRQDTLVTALWMVACLVAVDLGLSLAFRMPPVPTRPPAPLALYFHYGTSIEAKLRRMVAASDSASAPVARAGWLEPFNDGNAPLVARPGGRLVAVYGQSFAFQVVGPMVRMDTSLTLRTRGGPASPASHGYALWSADRGRVRPDVAILGILASSVRGIDANSAAAWQFESPSPFTYPRYRVAADGSLVASPPFLRSLADLRGALADPARWRTWEEQVARDDAWYDPLLWRASWLDRSSLARLLRRAWAQREQRLRLARLHDRDGFREDAEAVRVLRALAGSFVDGCRADGTLPVVLLLEDGGYSDHLSRLLGPELERRGAVWLGTHALADPSNPMNLKGDGHFIEAVNERLARELLRRVRAGLDDAGAGSAMSHRDRTESARPEANGAAK